MMKNNSLLSYLMNFICLLGIVTTLHAKDPGQPAALLTLQQDLSDFSTDPQLEIELWADSTQVHSPVAIDVDHKGRLWVVDDQSPASWSHILILSDTDRDGKADKVEPFGYEFVSKPMGISVFDNKIVVTESPNIYMITDVNRDDRFQKGVDTVEIIAKGFKGRNHDHALHQVVAGPSGKWYCNHGNIGADAEMADGRNIQASSYYSENSNNMGLKSYDDRVYIGGFGWRMNPDGSEAEVIFHNARNTHAMFVNSLGDIIIGDNDDPSHCRVTWVMENSNYGYASLEDGRTSWVEVSKSWETKEITDEIKKHLYEGHHNRPWVRNNEGHWRQNFPGVTPPGFIYGSGSPTGDYMVEGDELGKKFRGKYLICDTTNRSVFSFRTRFLDAQIDLDEFNRTFFAVDRKTKNKVAGAFMPTDIVANTDGSLYVSDWNSARNYRNARDPIGGIYRISKIDAPAVLPEIDFSTMQGLLEALKSPAPGVRWVAQDKIKKMDNAYDELVQFIEGNKDNFYYQARAIYILAQIKDKRGVDYVKSLIEPGDLQTQVVAYRALRFSPHVAKLSLINLMVENESRFVKREALALMRNLPIDQVATPLEKIIAEYKGDNRYYLEAIGSISDNDPPGFYSRFIKSKAGDPQKWQNKHINLAWRNRSEDALKDLSSYIEKQSLPVEEFTSLLYAYAISRSDTERNRNIAFLQGIAKVYPGEKYRRVINEFIEKELITSEVAKLTQNYQFPKRFGPETEVGSIEEIAKLKPDLVNGRIKSSMCLVCHAIGFDTGAAFGPDLTNWGQVRDENSVIRAIIDPNSEIAHGYEKPLIITQGDHELEGVRLGGHSYGSGVIKVKTMGGVTLRVPFKSKDTKVHYLDEHSWMPSASKMSLTNQDVKDISAYLMSDIASLIAAEIPPEKEVNGATWKPLFAGDSLEGWKSNQHWRGEKYDFNRNWKMKDAHLICDGSPTGLLISDKRYKNFELKFDWKHEKAAGNSGLFIWLKKAGKGLGTGVEVQILDPHYEKFYADKKKQRWKGEQKWFTGHGDVFPVGGDIQMTPFPPSAPEPRERFRSFPTENRTKPHGEWNHYHITAIGGVIRLSVNGKEVSGGYNCNPAQGPLAFESEGSPIQFTNIMIKELTDDAKDPGGLLKQSDEIDTATP